jgi:hypothetical protein
MQAAEARVAFVVRGVVSQAMADANARSLRLVHTHTAAAGLIERWCDIDLRADGDGLTVSAASKTELLLAGPAAPANLYPLGDLYSSELASWGVAELDDRVRDLAQEAGGLEHLDRVLRKLLDERRPADAAFADLPHIRDAVLTRLQNTRFHRANLGLVPKVGARTIGIDLHI